MQCVLQMLFGSHRVLPVRRTHWRSILPGCPDPALKPVDPKLLVGVSRNRPCGSGKKFNHCLGAF